MTKQQIRQFLKEQLLTKPIGKWNVIYSIWRGLIVAWWNTLLFWAAAANNQLFGLAFLYFLLFCLAILVYIIAKGK